MGKIFGSCGHEVAWNTVSVFRKMWSREWEPVISLETLCPDCLSLAKESDWILYTEEEMFNWVNQKEVAVVKRETTQGSKEETTP